MAPYKPADEIVPHPDEDIRVWMTEHGPALRRYFLKKVGPNEADDLVQEVFLSLQVRGSEGRIENVQGYLFRMAATALWMSVRTFSLAKLEKVGIEHLRRWAPLLLPLEDVGHLRQDVRSGGSGRHAVVSRALTAAVFVLTAVPAAGCAGTRTRTPRSRCPPP